MSYCIKCGKHTDLEDRYCSKCGAEIFGGTLELDEKAGSGETRCYYHPRNEIVGTCTVCCQSICAECMDKVGNKIVCNDVNPVKLDQIRPPIVYCYALS